MLDVPCTYIYYYFIQSVVLYVLIIWNVHGMVNVKVVVVELAILALL